MERDMVGREMEAREMPHLVLMGEVVWRYQGRRVALPKGRPSSIAVLLAQTQPGSVRVDAIIDRLWRDAPRSGANAVQRHVSTLRRSLREHGLPEEAIETTSDGYRLHPDVTTDAGILHDLLCTPHAVLPKPDTADAAVAWWLEPLPGIEWEPHAVFHSLLGQQSVGIAVRWAEAAMADGRSREVASVLVSLANVHPNEPAVWTLLQQAGECSGNRELVRAARTHTGPRLATHRGSDLVQDDCAVLEDCLGWWRAGDVDAACEELEAVAPYLSQDVARRAERCLVLIPHEDRLGEKLWGLLMGLSRTRPAVAERALVSLDAYALEQLSDGVEMCDAEVGRAESTDGVVRALRTRFMVGMTRPMTADQESIPERLAEIDTADAQVEASRFRVLLDVKRNRLDAAAERLERYERCVSEWWPDSRDEFAVTARYILGERVESQGSDGKMLARREVVDLVRTWERLDEGGPGRAEPLDGTYHGAIAAASPVLAASLAALRAHRSGEDSKMEPLLETLRASRPGRHHHAALVVLAWVAADNHDAGLARHVGRQLLPWAEEHLGLWPLHALFCPADEVIASIACGQGT